jgi:hypothetical protein
MTTPTTLTNGTHVNYGFGLSIVNMSLIKLASRRALTHNGGINGFRSQQIYVPADSLTVVVLTNTDEHAPDILTVEIVQAALEMRRATSRQ